MRALIDWVAERTGTSFIALNPLHAIANRQPYNTSPYLPNSIFYRNPIYLDVEAIPDFRRRRGPWLCMQSPAIQKEIAALRDAELVEYERVYRSEAALPEAAVSSFPRQRMAGWHRARARS